MFGSVHTCVQVSVCGVYIGGWGGGVGQRGSRVSAAASRVAAAAAATAAAGSNSLTCNKLAPPLEPPVPDDG